MRKNSVAWRSAPKLRPEGMSRCNHPPRNVSFREEARIQVTRFLTRDASYVTSAHIARLMWAPRLIVNLKGSSFCHLCFTPYIILRVTFSIISSVFGVPFVAVQRWHYVPLAMNKPPLIVAKHYCRLQQPAVEK